MTTQTIHDTIKEVIEHPESALRIPNGWKLQRLIGTDLWFLDFHGYSIPLDECDTKDQKMDWIEHMRHKTWVTDEMLGGLCRFLFWFSISGSDYTQILERIPHDIVTE